MKFDPIPTNFSLTDLFTLKSEQLTNGWNINAAPKVFAYLAKNKEYIFFGLETKTKPNYNSELLQGEFVEGLWKQDVAELFLFSEKGDYQEFNLSPSAAWWSAYFSEYRKELEDTFNIPENIETVAKIENNFWQAAIKIPLSQINIKDIQIVNATAIIYQEEVHYYSYHSLNSEKPDFHRRPEVL